MSHFQTVTYEIAEGVGYVTLNRPEAMNAFNSTMLRELSSIWRSMRADTNVRVAVLAAAGERAFCTGIDRQETFTAAGSGDVEEVGFRDGPFHWDDPGRLLGPKANDLWKPVIAAVDGIACGGAFYLLGEVDVIICTDRATFFDPHVSYGMPASYESILMASKLPLGEVLRMQLMGAAERMSSTRAHQIGLVSEVVDPADLLARAKEIATTIAGNFPLAVQATVRAIWAAAELSRSQAIELGNAFVAMGTDMDQLAAEQAKFAGGTRPEWTLR